MLVKDVFKETINGYNINNAAVNDDLATSYPVLQKDSIQYTNIVEKRLVNKKFSGKIREKYFVAPRDILIFIKKPYRVGTCQYDLRSKKIVISNNFIVLRDINMDYYSYIFVANYLEKIGIPKLVKEKNIIENLTVDKIINIDLPDIPKEKQMSISPLLNAINNRSKKYSDILANDDLIVQYAIKKVIGEEND